MSGYRQALNVKLWHGDEHTGTGPWEVTSEHMTSPARLHTETKWENKIREEDTVWGGGAYRKCFLNSLSQLDSLELILKSQHSGSAACVCVCACVHVYVCHYFPSHSFGTSARRQLCSTLLIVALPGAYSDNLAIQIQVSVFCSAARQSTKAHRETASLTTRLPLCLMIENRAVESQSWLNID